jgi:ABC-type Zn uptake system ZnuABC Zn-binding protein ZnuA
MDLPAGVIVELYRRRWEVEKVFDEIKNKLNEKKAWATSLVAKAAQGQMVAITHNLMIIYEERLKQKHGVSNEAEDERRAERIKELKEKARKAGRDVSALLLSARRTTQRSVKFVRWLRHALRENLAEAHAVTRLTSLYATS